MMPGASLSPLVLPSRRDPLLLVPGLALYLSAYDFASLADATAIPTWTGREAAHSAWTQATSGKRPTKATQGGWPVVRFVAANSQVLGCTISALQLAAKTVVIVARNSSAITATNPLLSSGAANWYVGGHHNTVDDQQFCSWANTAATQKSLDSTGAKWDQTLHVYTWRWVVSGANVTVEMWRDGTLARSTVFTATDGYQAVPSSGFTLGAFSNASTFWPGDVGAVLVTSDTTDAVRQLMERTLGPRWGLTVV